MSGLVKAGLLHGDNTIPGVSVTPEVRERTPGILEACRNFGADFYPTVVEFMDQDEISEIAAYGGFPNRYPHWQFGMEYTRLSRGYEHGQHVIYEMVINNDPCYIYCLNSNTYVDHINVIAHATFHNDFFKNNIFFAKTPRNMMDELANHGARIRRYIRRWGSETVGRFLDKLLSIDHLIDPEKAWGKKVYKEPTLVDKREYKNPRRFKTAEGHDYMEQWMNPSWFTEKENKRLEEEELRSLLNIQRCAEKDIFGFLKDNAPLQLWEQDVASMIYEESQYFAPQGATKTINEGWASYGDFNIMAILGHAGAEGIVHYADHKAGVLGPQSAIAYNPYHLGFKLLLDIEERWNKGRFGEEYENCKDLNRRENWDTNAGLGKEKVFEVRKCYNDILLINEFFTPEFCNKHEFFDTQHFPDGSIKMQSRKFPAIKEKILSRYKNFGRPDIRLEDSNFQDKGTLLLQHYNFDGRTLHPRDTKRTLAAMYCLWRRPVVLATYHDTGSEFLYVATGQEADSVITTSYKDFKKNF